MRFRFKPSIIAVKLATVMDGSRDYRRNAVAPALPSAHYVAGIATRMQHAGDNCARTAARWRQPSEAAWRDAPSAGVHR
jgi:hypothetical protein